MVAYFSNRFLVLKKPFDTQLPRYERVIQHFTLYNIRDWHFALAREQAGRLKH